jgi:hypothetical protein
MPSTTGVDPRLENVPTAVLDALTLTSGAPATLQVNAPVVALTCTDGRGHDRRVLICVRDPRANVTHPDVVSAPTKRVEGIEDLGDLLVDGRRWNGTVPGWLLTTADLILHGKLALPADVTAAGRVRRVSVWQGDSVIGMRGDEVVRESLTMINVQVDMTGSADLFPAATDSYREIHWVPEADHQLMTAMRNPALAGVDFAEPVPLVYGLCTRSTAATLAATSSTLRPPVRRRQAARL